MDSNLPRLQLELYKEIKKVSLPCFCLSEIEYLVSVLVYWNMEFMKIVFCAFFFKVKVKAYRIWFLHQLDHFAMSKSVNIALNLKMPNL